MPKNKKSKKTRDERSTTPESTDHTDPVVVSQPVSTSSHRENSPPETPRANPFGLGFLANLDSVLIEQEVELVEVVTGFETQNKYTIYDKFNHRILHAQEVSSCCSRQFCGSLRSFDMPLTNMDGQEVIRLIRPFACLQSIDVLSSQGALLGKVQQKWTLCLPEYVVQNEEGGAVLRIKGPCVTGSCFGDVEFDVLALDGKTKVGSISKKWSGIAREVLTDADTFGIEFPMDLDVKMKATMIGACMLIDFMFYEKSHTNKTI